MDFYEIGGAEPVEEKVALQASLEYAVDLYRNADRYSHGPYGAGPKAYSNWLKAVKDGHGGAHGAWWNGTVWAECRRNASEYLAEVALAGVIDADDLAATYGSIAGKLEKAADKQMPADEKISILESAAAEEVRAVEGIAVLAEALGRSG